MDREEVTYALIALDTKIQELTGLPEPLASQQIGPFAKLRVDMVNFLNSGKDEPKNNS